MKGENIPAHSAWAGAPAQPAKAIILNEVPVPAVVEAKPEVALAA